MKLTKEESEQIKEIAEWMNVDPKTMLVKMVRNQIEYCLEVKTECWQKQSITGKYELAALLKILE